MQVFDASWPSPAFQVRLVLMLVFGAAAGCVDTTPGEVDAGGIAGDAGAVDRGPPGAPEVGSPTRDTGGVGPASDTGGSDQITAPVSDGGPPGTAVEAGVEPRDFVCSQLIGLWVASQWWGSFEMGVDNPRWQFTYQHHGYLELFADPASPFWRNGIISACALQSKTPDRVLFLPYSLTLKTLEDWQTQLTKVVATMKEKFPGVKRIELFTTVRSPNNMLCPNNKDPGTIVQPYVDLAIETVAAESGGLVTVGPKIQVADCAWWAGGTDLTGAGNTGVGRLMAAYYRAHP